jgi:hypothetical protein
VQPGQIVVVAMAFETVVEVVAVVTLVVVEDPAAETGQIVV